MVAPAPRCYGRPVSANALLQRVVLDGLEADALRLPLGDTFARLCPGGCFPLVEDPRCSREALIFGMMVLRPASRPWQPDLTSDLPGAVGQAGPWCYDVKGIGGSWPVSAGNAVDACRLALQYGTVDTVLAGSATVAREGLVAGARPGHLWQPYTPLRWPGLREHRAVLEPAIAELRRAWQDLGLLSERRWPAQIAITASGTTAAGQPDLLDARMFHERHPDGSPMESYLLTSLAGADRLRERARLRGQSVEERLVVVSAPECPEEIDLGRVPAVLRSRLDARLVEHDGGGISLEAFAAAGALTQLHATLMRRRSVREILESSSRLEAATREQVLGRWPAPARLFPSPGGVLPESWRPVYALAEEGAGGEALVVTFDLSAGDRASAE